MNAQELTDNVEIIQTLGDYPNTEGGLTASQLKEKFDEGNKIIKEYINRELVPAINENRCLVVTTLDNDDKTASHTSGQVYSHIQNGGATVLYIDGIAYQMIKCTPLSALFGWYDVASFQFRSYEIKQDGTFRYHNNVACDMLKVTLSDDGIHASHTSDDIAEHLHTGGMAVLVNPYDENNYYSFISMKESNGCTVAFGSYDAYDMKFYTYTVNDIGVVHEEVRTAVDFDLYSKLKKKVDYFARPLAVSINNETGMASRNAREIYTHVINGGNVYLLADAISLEVQLESCNEDSAIFTHAGDGYYEQWIIGQDGTYEYYRNDISAGFFTVDLKPYGSSHSALEIIEHIGKGDIILGNWRLDILVMSGITQEVTNDGSLLFVHFKTTPIDGAWTEIIVDENKAVTVKTHELVESAQPRFANALKGTESGELVGLNDISPIPHDISVRLMSDAVANFSGIAVTQYGKNFINIADFTIGNTVANVALRLNVPLKSGKTYTLSADTETSDLESGAKCLVRDIENNVNLGYLHNGIGSYLTFTVGNVDCYRIAIYASTTHSTSLGATASFRNIQVEHGKYFTGYEPFKEPIEYAADADGAVYGIKGNGESMTLAVDTQGVVITAEYNRDANKVIAKLESAVSALLGG